MELIILVPGIICWIALGKWPIRRVFINVYLPTILLLPQYYIVRFPHLPPLTFADAAILPLGAALWIKEMKRWKLAWMDLWVLLFTLSTGVSEALSAALANGSWKNLFSVSTSEEIGRFPDGGLVLFQSICTMVLPYMVGRLLIERPWLVGNRLRKRVVQQFVTLLAIVAGISVFDFLAGNSIWQRVGRHLFFDQIAPWPVQTRWGFGRIQGPYSHAILAGMIFMIGLIYCLWLLMFAPEWGTRRVLHGHSLRLRGLVLWAIVAGLLMTQSRGPWVGAGLSLVLALLMRIFTIRKAVTAFLVILVLFGTFAYYYGKRYTDVDINHAQTEAQRNAIYRRELVRTYMPIIKQRPAFGWGITTLPALNGQASIDNEYLLLAATQGLTGLGLFLLILAGSGVRLFRLGSRNTGLEDKALVFAHMTVLMGLSAALATVFLGEQALMLLFLVVGWIHGMDPVGYEAQVAETKSFSFRKVLV